jgi:16S rRNA (guanine966-N2)-methyltransferase
LRNERDGKPPPGHTPGQVVTRIIAGAARGRRLRTPPGSATRPTADRVREALFSALDARVGSLQARRFLDVYAGSGAIGLEARSRGASAVTLIEANRGTAALIRQNVRDLGMESVTVLTGKAERIGAEAPAGQRFDVAFFDPPYSLATNRVGQVVADMLAAGWFSPAAVLVVERPLRAGDWEWPAGTEGTQSRRYGETVLWYGHLA